MPSTPLEILCLEIQSTEFPQVFRPQAGKFIQKLPQRLTLTFPEMSPTIKGRKWLSLARFEHHPCPRHPIRAFAVNQMSYDIKRAPGVFTFISERPGFWQVAQKLIESDGGASEKRYCVRQVMFHPAPPFLNNDFA
jgi:hypothetical protein